MTLNGTVNPEGLALDACTFEYGTTEAFGQTAACVPSVAEIGSPEGAVPVHADLTGLSPGNSYFFRLVASSPAGEARSTSDSVKTLSAPVISNEQATSVIFTEAMLQASINPEGTATSYRIEYGPTLAYGKSTPPMAVGSDRALHVVSTTLTGLVPGTTYHWRVVSTNDIGTTEGSDQTFTTFIPELGQQDCPNEVFRTGPASRLPDCRAYEMVSPVSKNNGDIQWLININSNPARLDQASVDGEKLTYTTSQGFAEPEGVPYVSQYLASRSAGGWMNRSITPSQGATALEIGFRIDLEYRAFTPDLCSGTLLHFTDPPLAPGAIRGVQNLYRRDLCGAGGFEALSTATPTPPVDISKYIPNVQGTSQDGRCTVFQTIVAAEMSIYESCGEGLLPINVLPNGDPSPAASVGTGVNNTLGPPRTGSVKNAVSESASTVYWTQSIGGEAPIFVRINAGQPQSGISGGVCNEPTRGCTFPVSETVSTEPAHFWSASTDGATAIFSVGTNLFEFTSRPKPRRRSPEDSRVWSARAKTQVECRLCRKKC